MIKNWKQLFSSTILSRGRNYLRQGRVDNLQIKKVKDGFNFYATVYGTHKYNVTGAVNNDTLKLISCNCPHAKQGIYCKHMAAVLLDIERTEAEEAKRLEDLKHPKVRLERPFSKTNDKSNYTLFDLNELTKDFIIYEDEFKKAKTLYINDRGEFNFSFSPGLYGDEYDSTKFRCTYKRNYLYFSQDFIDSINCDDYYWSESAYIHNHSEHGAVLPATAIAMLYASDLFIQENANYLDITDPGSKLLIDLSRNSLGSKGQETAPSKESVTLLPTLTLNNGDYVLTWKIGDKNKLFVLKDVNDLISAYSVKAKFRLGKNKTIDFSREDFDQDSKGYYKIIADSVDTAEKALTYVKSYRASWLSPTLNIKRETPIYKNAWDDFYDISKGKPIFYQDPNTKEKLPINFVEGTPSANLKIEKLVNNKDIFDGIEIHGFLPQIFNGTLHSYFIKLTDTSGELNRIPDNSQPNFGPLELIKNSSNEVYLQIGRNNLSEFYNYTLPELRKYVDFDEPDDDFISEYVSTTPEFTIYLDASSGLPEGKIAVTYDQKTYSIFDWQNNKADSTNRLKFIEEKAFDLMEKYLSVIDPDKEVFCCERSDEAIYTMLTRGVEEMLDFCEVKSTKQFDNLKVRRKAKISIGVSVESDLMNLEVSAEDISHDELLAILSSYKKRKRYHKLRNGQFVDINEDFEELGKMFDSLNISPGELKSGKAELPLYRTLYVEKLLEENDYFYTDRDSRFRELVRDFKTINESSYEVPKSLETVMRNYQIFGYKWLRMMTDYGFGCILADDMGLGKTLQVIGLFQANREMRNGQPSSPSLVVCPASLIYNWEDEIEKFAPDVKVQVIAGSKSVRKELVKRYCNNYDCDVLITSYDFLKRDVELYEDCSFEYVVIDEAQYIKNHNTGAAKSVKVIKARKKIALTGTPIENRLSELWSIFDFLMPGFLYTYDHFRKHIETPIIRNNDDDIMGSLKKMVQPFILRRLKSDVLKDLPEKIEEIKYMKMEEKQQNLYDGQVLKLKKFLINQEDNSFNKTKLQVLAELTKTRQICCDPSVLFEDYDGNSAKTQGCIQLIESAIDGEHKVLVFSQFTSILGILGQKLTAQGIKWYSITGKTPKQERLSLVKDFNSGDVPVFLISLKAGGTGLNLTGADIVVHFDPWWNVAAQNQATDRAHRIGQNRNVTVYKLIIKNSIEEKILDMQEKKKALADEIISGEFRGLSGMSKDEILELLE